MKQVYCGHCGALLLVSRRAMPKYGRIIDIVPYHECPEDPPIEFDIQEVPVPYFEENAKFVHKLNELDPKGELTGASLPPTRDVEPGDRRAAEHVKPGSQPTSHTFDMIEKIKGNLMPKE